ncbi:cell wall hydrolase [Marinovum sp. 2_MG-2023]|uniref:cell wall hydrolase n=1 Tax=Roseobacteraceae TaxID=2854170 RepID=UPI001FD4D593|nr:MULTISPECIES: cell wall hydrolase [Roseobacteraceae]MCJ7875019.1 cell wall hydrolase [Phaeobacter sp. J2-8]MDO6730561.1 cell wall hydrolase [Marinovum sp. 2_MG-2023]MDO6778711.1 cell wall hydrolase [Marinovum sp. 1_MG-2023]
MSVTQMTGLRVIALVGLSVLAACGGPKSKPSKPQAADLECMSRAMYFESNRSSWDGMIAVGSVVMNRVKSDAFPNTVCGVVSQKNQFAPGVMSKPMTDRGAPLAQEAARAVLSGTRHPHVGIAKFFHAAWYQANYNNMHYVVTTGGNAFYEKRRAEFVTASSPRPPTEGLAPR